MRGEYITKKINMDSIFGNVTPVVYSIVLYTLFSLVAIPVLDFFAKIYYTKFARYTKQKKLLTFHEKKFFYTLIHVINGKYSILSKVRVADIIGVRVHSIQK